MWIWWDQEMGSGWGTRKRILVWTDTSTQGVRIFHLHLTSAELQGPRIAHPALRADGREEERRTWRRRGVEEVSWALTGDNSYVLDRRFASGAVHSEGVQKVGLSN